jgi:hypothetical protein
MHVTCIEVAPESDLGNGTVCLDWHFSGSKSLQTYEGIFNFNSVALVRKQTIPTERPPHVGEVGSNFLLTEGVAWSAQRIPTTVNLGFLDPEPLIFIQVAPQLSSRG